MPPQVKDPSFHYTKEEMVRDLLAMTPIDETDSILDAGSGPNKVWYKNFSNIGKHYECELDDGNDFFDWREPVDWIVGNPPFHISWKFIVHASTVACKGMAFLVNGKTMDYFPPKFDVLAQNGFYLQHLHLLKDKRWYGTYLYMIFTKEPQIFLTWNTTAYK